MSNHILVSCFENEYFYLIVSHAKGDTSYYDYYNGKEPYFITYDSDDISEITIQDANQNIFKADLRESC